MLLAEWHNPDQQLPSSQGRQYPLYKSSIVAEFTEADKRARTPE